MATMGVAIGVRASVGKGEIRNEGRGKVRNEVEGGEGGEGYVLDWTGWRKYVYKSVKTHPHLCSI